MLSISLLSQKGGSGKTTLAIHLAAEAACRGARTLLIDLDPQASAIRWGDRRGDRTPDVASEHPARLAAAIQAAAGDGYALVIIDTAPHADHAALQVARVADLVLVPCRPAILDLDAIGATLDLCRLAQRAAGATVVVLNAAPVRSRVVDDAAGAVARLGGTVAGIVRERVAFRHALIAGGVASEYEPDGLAAAEIAALYDIVACRHANMHTTGHDRELR